MGAPWKWGDGAEGLVLVEDRRGLASSLLHVALHGVELRHGPTVRLSRGSFDHVAGILRSPECGVTAKRKIHSEWVCVRVRESEPPPTGLLAYCQLTCDPDTINPWGKNRGGKLKFTNATNSVSLEHTASTCLGVAPPFEPARHGPLSHICCNSTFRINPGVCACVCVCVT